MGQLEKAKNRIKTCPKDYTYDEARALLGRLGFEEYNKGKTSGSRVRFFRKIDGKLIDLHKPHPQSTMKEYSIKALKTFLEEIGEI